MLALYKDLAASRYYAVVVPPGRSINLFLRPFLPADLKNSPVNMEDAYSEFENYVSCFRENGIEVILLHEIDHTFSELLHELPDSVFPEDWVRPLLSRSMGETVFIRARMTAESRSTEPHIGLETLHRVGALNGHQVLDIDGSYPDARFEAGDILPLQRADGTPIILFGISSRSNWQAFLCLKEISRTLDFGEIYPIGVFSQRCLHLTTGAGPLNSETLVFDPLLINAEDLKRVPGLVCETSARKDWGNLNCPNTVWFPTTNRVAMDDRFSDTLSKIEKLGIAIIPLSNREHAKGAGGLSCRNLCWISQDSFGKGN